LKECNLKEKNEFRKMLIKRTTYPEIMYIKNCERIDNNKYFQQTHYFCRYYRKLLPQKKINLSILSILWHTVHVDVPWVIDIK